MIFRLFGLDGHAPPAMIAALCAMATGVADAGPPVPTVTVEACTTCHGPGGISQGGMATIAGRDAETMGAAMRAFRDGTREGTIMGRLMGPLSDAEIAAIAGYFSGLPGPEQ